MPKPGRVAAQADDRTGGDPVSSSSRRSSVRVRPRRRRTRGDGRRVDREPPGGKGGTSRARNTNSPVLKALRRHGLSMIVLDPAAAVSLGKVTRSLRGQDDVLNTSTLYVSLQAAALLASPPVNPLARVSAWKG